MILSSVDFPPPDGPVMMTNERGSTWKVTSLRTRFCGRSPTDRKYLAVDLDRERPRHRRHLLALAMSGCMIASSMICTTMMKASAYERIIGTSNNWKAMLS